MGKFIEELFNENGGKFPFTIKISDDPDSLAWYNKYYRHIPTFTFVKMNKEQFFLTKYYILKTMEHVMVFLEILVINGI